MIVRPVSSVSSEDLKSLMFVTVGVAFIVYRESIVGAEISISYSVPETRFSNVTFGTVTSFVSSKPALSVMVTTHFSGASPSYCHVSRAEELDVTMDTLSGTRSTVGTVESVAAVAPVSSVFSGGSSVKVYSEPDCRSLITTEWPEKVTVLASAPSAAYESVQLSKSGPS